MLIRNDPFGRGKWIDFINQLLFLKHRRLTVEDIKRALETPPVTSRHCPICNAIMRITSVNTGPGDRTGDDSKSVWICSNKECMETIYSNLSASKEFWKLEEGRHGVA